MTQPSKLFYWSCLFWSHLLFSRVHNLTVEKSKNIEELRTPSRRERKAAATRRSLFDAGLDAFEHRPFGLVSVLDLTEAVDVAKGVFYLHFRSKDDFVLELLRHVFDEFLDSLEVALSGVVGHAARIRAAVQHYIGFSTTNPAAARFLIRMSGYFPGEIGPPGELVTVRTTYRERLAAILGSANSKSTDSNLQWACALDACCWGLIGDSLLVDAPLPDGNVAAKLVEAGLRSMTGAKRQRSR